MTSSLHLEFASLPPRSVVITKAVIAGWTGRDRDAVEKHIRELEAIGVKRPSTTPVYYRVAASRVTTADTIQVTGNASSGEVEFVLLQANGELWVGVGSDHTDRTVETYDVTVSKQMCDKPIAPVFWRYSEIQDHWDRLELRSWIDDEGERKLYQEGTVAAMLPPAQLIEGYMSAPALPEGCVMFCGTLAAIGGVRPSERFVFELLDPLSGKAITHGYTCENLPNVS